MRGLYVVAAVVMAGTSAVFVLLAELEHRYGLSTGSLGLIAGSAFAAALATQLGLARYADRGYGGLLLRVGVAMASVGLLWFAAATELWQFVAARAILGASVGMIIPAARRAIVLASDGNLGERLGVFYAAYLAGFVFGPPVAGFLTVIGDVRLPFLVLGIAVAVSSLSLRGVVVDAARRPERAAGGGPQAGAAPTDHFATGDRSDAHRRLVPLLGRGVRTAVGDVPRLARRVDVHDHDLA